MLGKVMYKRNESAVIDTIHSIHLFDGEEVTLHGHLRDYIITKNEVIVESEVSEFTVNNLRFMDYDNHKYEFMKDVSNDFLEDTFARFITW